MNTGKGRYEAVLRGQPCDWVPRTPILMQFAAESIGSNYAAFASDYRVLVEANLHCAEAFGMDQVSVISDPYRETHGFGGQVTFVADGVPRCTEPLAHDKDISRLKQPDPDCSERMRDRLQAVAAFKAQAGGRYSILGWVEGPAAEAADLRGMANFMMDLYDDAAFAEALLDRTTEVAMRFAQAQIAAGCDTVGIGDAICSLLPPEIYGRLIWPRQKQLVDLIHRAGAYVKLHICGNITHLLPSLARLGVDILDVDHMVDMAAARAGMGRGVALAGNLNPAGDLLWGRPDKIREEVERIYTQVGNPFMVNAGCEIPAATPHENLRALCRPLPWRKEGF